MPKKKGPTSYVLGQHGGLSGSVYPVAATGDRQGDVIHSPAGHTVRSPGLPGMKPF